VKEFVGDWYDASYYTAVPDRVVSPSGPETGYFRALRGGSFGVIEANLRAAKRFQDHAGMGVYNDVGFRCAFPFED
jgi:formylglycine-generating enzyme required for sulfatase activity